MPPCFLLRLRCRRSFRHATPRPLSLSRKRSRALPPSFRRWIRSRPLGYLSCRLTSPRSCTDHHSGGSAMRTPSCMMRCMMRRVAATSDQRRCCGGARTRFGCCWLSSRRISLCSGKTPHLMLRSLWYWTVGRRVGAAAAGLRKRQNRRVATRCRLWPNFPSCSGHAQLDTERA